MCFRFFTRYCFVLIRYLQLYVNETRSNPVWSSVFQFFLHFRWNNLSMYVNEGKIFVWKVYVTFNYSGKEAEKISPWIVSTICVCMWIVCAFNKIKIVPKSVIKITETLKFSIEINESDFYDVCESHKHHHDDGKHCIIFPRPEFL